MILCLHNEFPSLLKILRSAFIQTRLNLRCMLLWSLHAHEVSPPGHHCKILMPPTFHPICSLPPVLTMNIRYLMIDQIPPLRACLVCDYDVMHAHLFSLLHGYYNDGILFSRLRIQIFNPPYIQHASPTSPPPQIRLDRLLYYSSVPIDIQVLVRTSPPYDTLPPF